MNEQNLQKLQDIANSPAAKALLEHSVPAPQPPKPNRKARRAAAKKAKRPSKDKTVHLYAERIRHMTDEQIWAEGHKEPTPEIVESVIRDMHEDIISVLAPHFGDDIMTKIDQVLHDWYHTAKGFTFTGPVQEGGIDRPLTEADKTEAAGVLGQNPLNEYEEIRAQALQRLKEEGKPMPLSEAEKKQSFTGLINALGNINEAKEK